jgi:OOP family OmpA-OmpF porin
MGVANLCTVDFLKKENGLNLLVKAGYGFTGAKTKVITNTNTLKSSTINHQNFIPIGVGAKFKVSKKINFDLGYNTYLFDGDELDGTNTGITANDKFAYIYTGLEFSLGKVTKPNLDWVNPIALMYDELKDPALRKELDALKERVSTLEAADLLKDSDGDGVADKLDKCPNTEAGVKVDGGGCPLDTDNDGVPDSKDSCPTEKGVAEFNGCPNSPSSSANVIQFEFNSSVLKTSSYPVLDQLSNSLRSNEILKVELGGHASLEGTPNYNLQLSKDRANAVKTYLVNSGVAANKIVANGYGETRPVASNTTEEGRQLNRRVEIVK